MLLWTWQNPNVSPTKGEYDSLKYSDYIHEPCTPKSERERFITAYKEIWNRLGKKSERIKILWCYTNENEAKGAKCSNKNKVLWEIDVPEENIRYVCSIAWHWILYGRGCAAPERFVNFYRTFYDGNFIREQFYKEFDKEWQRMKQKELWNILFINKPIEGCTTAIVEHPLKDNWVLST